MSLRGLALAAVATLLPVTLAAQWSIENETAEDDRPDAKVAVGRNDNGDTLRVRRTSDDAVEAMLVLRPGLSRLAEGCPSYRVDSEKPRALVTNGDMCQAKGRSVTFILGHVVDEKVNSEALLEMMNGSRIRFIYHVHAAGYDEAGFSLSGSKQAINEVLGGKITVNGR